MHRNGRGRGILCAVGEKAKRIMRNKKSAVLHMTAVEDLRREIFGQEEASQAKLYTILQD